MNVFYTKKSRRFSYLAASPPPCAIYTNDEDLPIIEKVFAEEQKNYQQPLAVEKLPLQNFYAAEEYHQDYLDKNPTGYCHLPVSLFEFARKAKDSSVSQ